jgi:tight adherence protein C
VSSLVGLLPRANFELMAAVTSGLVCLMALVGAMRSLVAGPDQIAERLERIRRDGGDGHGARIASLDSSAGPAAPFIAALLRPLAKLARPSRPEELSRLGLLLVRAGCRRPGAMEIFLGLKVLLAPLLTLAFIEVNAHLARPLQFPMDVAIAVWICVVTFFAPNLWLRRRIAQRQLVIERALPDAMDLLVTCVEAGLGLDAAIGRVSEEIALAAPLVAEELTHTALEVQAGITRAEAFRRLAERTGVEDLRTLSAMLIQTDTFGTSIARALRVHSEGMRTKRMQRAEERGAMVSVKMTIPLVLCILPSLIAVVMGPAVVSIIEAFFNSH